LDKFQLRGVSSGLEVQGNLATDFKGDSQNGGMLSGNVTIDKSTYHTELSISDIILNSVTNSTGNVSELASYEYLSKIDIKLDIQLVEPLKLDTNFLKMQWRSKKPLLIKGSLSQPMLKGTIELLPGGLLTNVFPTGDMRLERGTIDFTDKVPFDPSINIEGAMTIANYSVVLNAFGNISAIQVNLSSIPSLRQDQLLTALMNPFVMNETASSSGQLTQTAVGNNLITNLLTSLALYSSQERMRKILNLDRVNLSFQALTSNHDFTITVGKNLNLLGHHLPLIITHSRINNTGRSSGKVEWRSGNLIFRLGATNGAGRQDTDVQSTNKPNFVPSGDIYYTWSPK